MTEFSSVRLTWCPPTGIHGFLAAAAARVPERPFLCTAERVVTYAEAWDSARRLASWLASCGVERGDRVAIHVRNRPELPVALFAASLLGAIHVVLNAKLRPAGAAKILAQCEPMAVIADADCLENLTGIDPTTARLLCGEGACGGWTAWEEAVAAEPWEREWPGIDVDPASLVFTSGSTGTPRGETLTHANILFVTGAIQERLGYREDGMVGCFLPMSFDYGLYQIFLAAQAGLSRALYGGPGKGEEELAARPGDFVSIPNVGAYGVTGSLVAFLSRPAPAVTLYRGREVLSAARLRGGHESILHSKTQNPPTSAALCP